jgi:hypothetical protein
MEEQYLENQPIDSIANGLLEGRNATPCSAQLAYETNAKRTEFGAQLLTLMVPCAPNRGIRHSGLVQSLSIRHSSM